MVSPSPAAKATASRNPNPEIAPRPTAWLKSKTRPAAIVVSIVPPFYCAFGCSAPSPLADAPRGRRKSRCPSQLSGLEKPRFLERAFDNGLGVDVQPILQDGGIQATEVQGGRQVPLRQVFRLARRILTILPTFHRVTNHEGRATRAVVRARAVIAHPPPKLREQ